MLITGSPTTLPYFLIASRASSAETSSKNVTNRFTLPSGLTAHEPTPPSFNMCGAILSAANISPTHLTFDTAFIFDVKSVFTSANHAFFGTYVCRSTPMASRFSLSDASGIWSNCINTWRFWIPLAASADMLLSKPASIPGIGTNCLDFSSTGISPHFSVAFEEVILGSIVLSVSLSLSLAETINAAKTDRSIIVVNAITPIFLFISLLSLKGLSYVEKLYSHTSYN